jgi:hypothetical protein
MLLCESTGIMTRMILAAEYIPSPLRLARMLGRTSLGNRESDPTIADFLPGIGEGIPRFPIWPGTGIGGVPIWRAGDFLVWGP